MIEFELSTSSLSAGVEGCILHYVERVSVLIERALIVQVSTLICTDDAAMIAKSVCVGKFFFINLD